MADRTLTVNGQPFTFNRDRFAGVRTMTSGHVYSDTLLESSFNADGVNYTRISEQAFTVVASNSTAHKYLHFLRADSGSDRLRMGKNRITCDITVNSGSISSFTGYYADVDAVSDPPTYGNFNITEGSNVIDIEIFDDGNPIAVNQSHPIIMIRVDSGSTCDISVTNLKITHNYGEITVNRTAPVITSDREGESRPLLSKLVGGAAAAYSLRDLNDKQGNNKVVRVRRASDNHERDFLAKEVSNGTLTNWVNTQVTAPLDIQEIADSNSDGNNDGRVGDFLIAKAAYSLRSLGTRQATIPNDAAPLNADTVVPASGKYVVQVRRNVNGDQKSFTADEVTDGTLLSFVNESFTSSLPLDVQGSAAAAYSLRNLSSSYSGNVVEVRNVAGNTQNFKASEITDGTLVDFVLGNTVSLVNNRAYFDGSSNYIAYSNGSDFSLSSNESFELSFNFVYVESSNLNRRILSVADSSSNNNVFEIYKQPSASSSAIGIMFGGDATAKVNTGTLTSGKEYLIKFGYNGSSFFCNLDGTTVQSSTETHSGISTAGNLIVGARHDTNQKSTGVVSNISFSKSGTTVFSVSGHGTTASNWTSDQSDSPTINGTLAAYTGQEMDGFVKTWYDQSGSSNDAVQATAANQPKIVSAGVLNTDDAGKPQIAFGSDPTFLSFTQAAFTNETIFVKSSNVLVNAFSAVISNADNRAVIDQDTGGVSYNVSAGGFRGITATHTNDDQVFTFMRDGTNVSIFQNGTAKGTNTTYANNSINRSVIGRRGDTEGNYSGGMGEYILYNSSQSENRRALEESISGHYGITLASFNRNGFVRTWYDQSVSDQAGTATQNHAVQTAVSSMPQIVENGNLLTAGVTFNGGDSLSVSGDPVITASSSGTYSAFSVQTVATSEAGYLYGNASASNGSSLYAGVNNFTLSNKNSATIELIDSISRSSGQNLLSAVYNNGDAGLLVNGAGTMTDAGTYDFSAGSSDFIIGNRNGGSASATFLTGSINEIIVYNSNQTANRTAIEANIGSVYSIDLPSGVDSGFDQVDGFVETWYDQSGNSRDAVQATAANQPKIVENGNLRNELVFDGSNHFLQTLNDFDAFGANSLGLFMVVNPSSTSGNPRFLNTRAGTSGIELILNATPRLYYKDSGGNGTNGASQSASLSAGTEVIYTNLVDRDTDQTVDAFKNGSSVTTGSPPDLTGVGSVNSVELTIGADNSGGNLYNGNTKEIIIYASNQEANRPAIEANINNQYDIYS